MVDFQSCLGSGKQPEFLVEFLGIVAVIGVLLALNLPAIGRSRSAQPSLEEWIGDVVGLGMIAVLLGCAWFVVAGWIKAGGRSQPIGKQFSLGRGLQLVIVVALISALFAHWKWPLALLALSGLNAAASAWFWFTKRRLLARMTLLSSLLMFASLLLTDWGLSSPRPVVRVAWSVLVPACITELLTILVWLVYLPRPTCPSLDRTADSGPGH